LRCRLRAGLAERKPDAYVVKARMASDLVLALQTALRGDRFISPYTGLEEVDDQKLLTTCHF
jgi:hypothetical protein